MPPSFFARKYAWPIAVFSCLLLVAAVLLVLPKATAAPVATGQRVLVVGHSFHVPMAAPLTAIAKAGGYADHQLVHMQFLGNSTVTQHWNLPDEKNAAKKHLAAGKVDVLTLSPHLLIPDEGITRFTELLLQHNPDARVLIQESWLPFDGQTPKDQKDAAALKRNERTVEELQQLQAPWVKALETHLQQINAQHKRQVVFVVPVAQAINALRGKIIAGEAPGLATQEQLFIDAMGHPGPEITLLSTYCHYAVIYRKSPVGIPLPAALHKLIDAQLNQLLQQLAWEAVTTHPLSGVTVEKPKP